VASEFLVVYDYGMGALWAVVLADSADEITARVDLYLSTIRAFDEAIYNGIEPRVTGLDGVRSLAAAVAALEALQTGCVAQVEQIL